jgi:perosamine synthetase
VNCALGIAQVQRLDEILAKRRAVAYAYTELLGGVEEVVTPAPDAPDSQTSWFVYVVRVADTLKRGDRDRVMRILQEHGVACSRYFAPIHLQKPYREMFGYAPGDFPVTEFVADRTIALPFHNRLTRDEIAYVCSTLIAAVRSTRSVFAMQVLDADPGVRSEV